MYTTDASTLKPRGISSADCMFYTTACYNLVPIGGVCIDRSDNITARSPHCRVNKARCSVHSAQLSLTFS